MEVTKKKTIGICTPCLNEEESILSCVQAVRKLFANELSHYNYQHLISDNGSTDKTVEILRREAAHDKNLRVIVNARNFGFGNSLINANTTVEGDAVLLFLPADLQDPPELIPQFVKKWEEGYQVVSGVRNRRNEPLKMKFFRALHYWLVKKFSRLDMKIGAGEFMLVDRVVVEALRTFDDYDPYVRGMIPFCGYRRISINYEWQRRRYGKTTTNWSYLYDFNMNGLVYLTKAPIRMAIFVGLFFLLISVLAAAAFLFMSDVSGAWWISALLTFLSGVNLFFVGIVGEYVLATHSQVRTKPRVLESERINFPQGHSA